MIDIGEKVRIPAINIDGVVDEIHHCRGGVIKYKVMYWDGNTKMEGLFYPEELEKFEVRDVKQDIL